MKFVILCFFYFLVLTNCTNTTEPEPENDIIVSMDALEVSEGDEDKPVYINVRLSKVSSETVVVIVDTQDETAEAGTDYKGLDNYPIEFLPGDVQNSLRLDIKGDEMHEEDESFLVRVVSPLPNDGSVPETRISILNDDRDTSLTIPSTGYTSPEEYEGMELIWHDEFDAGSNIENNWTFEVGGNWFNNEIQYYRKENTRIHKDGFLVIEARDEKFGNRNHTSSRLITKDKFEFKYGRVDIRANLPFGQGIWPALWMLGHNINSVGWPACGEIDIMELIGHQPSTTHGTIHWSQDGQHAQYGGSKSLSEGIFNDEFHVFSIIWDENKIEWLLDGQKFHEVDIRPPQLSEFHHEHFFIFNVAVGGNWPGNPDSTTEFPQRMIVDYIRVFQ